MRHLVVSLLRVAMCVLALAAIASLLACGGTVNSLSSSGEPNDAGACPPSPCPSSLAWDPVRCVCDVSVDAGLPVEQDAAAACPAIRCPAGSVQGMLGGECACVPVDSGVPVDASLDDVTPDSASPDVSEEPYYPDTSAPDVFYPYYPDVGPDLGPPDTSYFGDGGCPGYFCGNGYVPDPFCMCVPCSNTCPAGQTPGPGCTACVACSYTCPADFEYGPGCSCVPRGTDAGNVPVDAGDGGGTTCLLEGYRQCSAGSWCELGICPDNKTQYGCYCNADGTATCDLTCPSPPPCTIPGEGTCPYGSQCVYGSCAGTPAGSLLVCSCNSGGTAYCYTSSCADGGAFVGDAGNRDGGDGGVMCLLEGYYSCIAGSFCSLGSCPDGTPYGCFCNQDGTATCNLVCPPPPPCEIPGEGTCPYQTQCVYGTCSGNVGTQLSCYCSYGGSASCYTSSCGASDGGVFD